MIRIRRRGRFAAAVVIGFVAAGLVALTATGAVRVLGLPTYTGPESKYPKTYPTPTKKPGFKCTIGFLNPLAANEFLISLQHGIEAESKKLGCSAVSKDAQLNVDKQVTEFNDLIAQKVSAIIVFPNDPKALDPSIAKAKRAGIPVIGIDVTFQAKDAVNKTIVSQVWQSRDEQAFLEAAEMAKLKPHAKVVVIGIGIPVPSLKYWSQRVHFWAAKDGLTVLGEQDNPSDDSSGGQQAMTGLLGKFPNIDGVIAYNDYSALGAWAADRAGGRTKILIEGNNGQTVGIQAVKTGKIAATFQIDAIGMGVQSTNAAYDALTKQGGKLPKIVVRHVVPVTKANVASIVPWSQQVKKIR